MKKVLVSLPEEIVDLMDGELRGKLGDGHSDIIRTITMMWLAQNGYLAKGGKHA